MVDYDYDELSLYDEDRDSVPLEDGAFELIHDVSGEVLSAVGTRVSYEDMANPRCEGVVAEVLRSSFGRQYRVIWDGGEEAWSDLRQRGWRVCP